MSCKILGRECKITQSVKMNFKFSWSGQWLYWNLVRCRCCSSVTPLRSLSKQFITSLSLSLSRETAEFAMCRARELCGGKRAVHGRTDGRTELAAAQKPRSVARRGGSVRPSPLALCSAARHAGTSDPRRVFFSAPWSSLLSSVVAVAAADSR
jgi:hypothetical protein